MKKTIITLLAGLLLAPNLFAGAKACITEEAGLDIIQAMKSETLSIQDLPGIVTVTNPGQKINLNDLVYDYLNIKENLSLKEIEDLLTKTSDLSLRVFTLAKNSNDGSMIEAKDFCADVDEKNAKLIVRGMNSLYTINFNATTRLQEVLQAKLVEGILNIKEERIKDEIKDLEAKLEILKGSTSTSASRDEKTKADENQSENLQTPKASS